MHINKLFNNWQQLLKSVRVSDEVRIAQTFAEIVEIYSSYGRYYHNLEHIAQVLNKIQLLQTNIHPSPAVQLAAWFHDVIYDSQAKNNEEKSADYAHELLTSLNVSQMIIDNVCRLILNTKYHQAELNDFDSYLLLDADLSILGSSPEAYINYRQAIRQEYIWLPDDKYIAGRRKILENFLQRRIFFTDELFNQLELIARQNIQAEIIALENFNS
ncbi:hypothetical protein [Calothrix sp. UHCC 0171]|uniref:HD domain-containing protein n=1 Tax=Calothrix sp. UHCC 0171 TaxID=3110245 RepID=UPI002B1ECCC1|nr:hypothetical protein [Calothrix sp. UHCC 0171]MEA5569528.1 hypothetical protein [Calothrix sp. UHCC 0171]